MADNDEAAPAMGIKRVQTSQSNKAQRLLRVDQIYSRKDRQVHFVKTAKAKPPPDRADKTALIVRRIISKKGAVANTEVDIKSEPLARAMQTFFKNADGLSLSKTPPMAHPHHFFHARQYLWDEKEAEKTKPHPSQALIDDFGTALRFIQEDFGSTVSDLDTLLPQGDITFGLLWTLFPVNEPILVPRHGELGNKQVMYLTDTSYETRPNNSEYLLVKGKLMNHDGEDFGYAIDSIAIDEFAGSKKITALTAFPLKHHPAAKDLRQELIERGKGYVSCIRRPCYLDYTASWGMKIYTAPDAKEHRVKVAATGRCMIDPTAFSYYGEMRSLNEPWVWSENAVDGFDTLTEKDFLVCPWWVNGFCFGSKIWARFEVDKFVEPKWSDDAFGKLVLDDKWRRVVYGLVKAHRKDESTFDDITQNKGKGLVGLLGGSPGVGKTATAEAVAEVTRRPLYQASGGELGMEPDKVDKRLETILEITRRWEAVLLIDEADVFLATRGKSVAQDTLVSIFLRRIEYFQGVLILTTNRGDEIDHAFQSRIHFRLHYPDLDAVKRAHIWRMFVAEQKEFLAIDEADILELSKRKLNGRQIKNGTSCLVSLARQEHKRMEMSEISDLLDVIFGEQD